MAKSIKFINISLFRLKQGANRSGRNRISFPSITNQVWKNLIHPFVNMFWELVKPLQI